MAKIYGTCTKFIEEEWDEEDEIKRIWLRIGVVNVQLTPFDKYTVVTRLGSFNFKYNDVTMANCFREVESQWLVNKHAKSAEFV